MVIIVRSVIKKMIGINKRVLEIGPLTSPLVSKNESNFVFYADKRSTKDVKEFYANDPNVDCSKIVNIDFVISSTISEALNSAQKFDYVITSHVLEHMKDIIFYFNDICSCLNEEGKVISIIPDKRYCFDIFRRESAFCDALDVYRHGTERLERNVFDALYNTAEHKNPSYFWKNNCKYESILWRKYDEAIKGTKQFLNGEIEDFHYWTFTDKGFLCFIFEMTRAGMLPYTVDYFLKTETDTCEFCVILKKNMEIIHNQQFRDSELLRLCSMLAETSDDNKNRQQSIAYKFYRNISRLTKVIQKKITNSLGGTAK